GQLGNRRHFYVMERLQGESLRSYLARAGGLKPEHAFDILLPIANALIAAHEQGIVHRDLKPDNVFLASDGVGGTVVKLLDFGIAKLITLSRSNVTRTGGPIGTPLYMAPEQCAGLEVDARADIYAFGVMAFELIIGECPFLGGTIMEIFTRK